ncbi:MAG: hypothetical protein ABI613_10605 [Gemmatimonadota bacterium]
MKTGNPVRDIVEPFLHRVDAAIGAGYSAVLYGSVARGDQVAELSDVNLLLILERLDFATLDALEPSFSAWVENRIAPPLLMTLSEWDRASDVFPVEIADMKAAYLVLRGSDPVASLRVSRADLRRALEREYRGKLTRLRQGFVPSKRRPEDLTSLARHSIASVTTLYRGLLTLAGRKTPADAGSVLGAAAELVGFSGTAILSIAANREDPRWTCRREDLEGYMQAVEQTVSYVDELQLGDQE